jgi:hypothetical protein
MIIGAYLFLTMFCSGVGFGLAEALPDLAPYPPLAGDLAGDPGLLDILKRF